MKKVPILQLFAGFLFLFNSGNAQECLNGGCSNLNKNYPSSPFGGQNNPFTATTSWSTINSTINGGNYAYYNVTAGNTYFWTTCSTYGGHTGFDAELTIFDCNGNKICYSNDYCDGTGAFLSWTATCNTTVKILVSAFNGSSYCVNNGPTGPYCTLRWMYCPALSNGTIQPQSQTVSSGSKATFNTSVNGTPPFSYFWYKDGNFTGKSTTNTSSTTDSYTTPTLTATDNQSRYYCLIQNCSNLIQVKSNTAIITVTQTCEAPSVSGPSTQTVNSPDAATFTVNATGTSPYNYQWQVLPPSGSWSNLNNSENNTWTNSEGSSTLTISNTTGLNNYQYRCIVNNGCNPAATSSAALLTVKISTSDYIISGNITLSGNPLSGATLKGSPGNYSASTNNLGNYSLSIPSGWTGTVTPTLSSYSFTPERKSYNNINVNQSSQNYVAANISIPTVNSITFTNVIENHAGIDRNFQLYSGSPTAIDNPIKICADGSTATYISVNVSNTANVSFKILDENGNQISNPAKDGILGTPYIFGGNNVEVAYTHPEYMDENSLYRPLTLKVTYNGTPVNSISFPLRIYRSPVMFVHGLWGGSTSFEKMHDNFYTTFFCPKSLMLKVDYNMGEYKGASRSFSENSYVIYQNTNQLLKQSRDSRFSSSKIDIVAHSMGSILSRLYITDKNPHHYRNDIHKLITIDGPYSGTQAANLLLGPWGDEARTLLELKGNSTGMGAVENLRVNSAAIANLNNQPLNKYHIPTYAIRNYIDINNAGTFDGNWDKFLIDYTFNKRKCDYLVKFNIHNAKELLNFIYYGENSDLIVPISSQQGGISRYNSTNYPNVHTATKDDISLINHVKHKLNENPNDDNLFDKNGFTPTPLEHRISLDEVFQNPVSCQSNRVQSSGVKITSPVTHADLPNNSSISLSITSASPINNLKCQIFNNESSLLSIDTFKSSINLNVPIPSYASGNYKIIAAGYDNENFVDLDTISIFISPVASVDSLIVTQDSLSLPTNSLSSFRIHAVYNDGITRDISDFPDISYNISDTTIANYYLKNVIVGKRPGLTKATVTYLKKDKSLPVRIYSDLSVGMASFICESNNICKGSSLTFQNKSTNNPSSVLWLFAGGAPSSSTSQSPSINYPTPGSYDVTLIAYYSGKNDTLILPSYIIVDSVGSPSIGMANEKDNIVLISSSTKGNKWYKNNAIIPGAINQTYIPTTSGVYKLQSNTGCLSDTSNSITIPSSFTFMGNGSWDNAANWNTPIIPPSTLLVGSEVIISPAGSGECNLYRNPTVQRGSKLTVIASKKFNVINSPGSTLADTDSNLYSAIKICDQEWTDKNLQVTHYRNGDTIPQVQDPVAWSYLTSGAWCYYQNNTVNGMVYGKLYNWYAVNDPRGLAPTGWHIPSDAEWTNLVETCLGGASIAGSKMKTAGTIEAGTGLWTGANNTSTNSSGFFGVPAGNRSVNGVFANIGSSALWWSSTQSSSSNAGFTEADAGIGEVSISSYSKKLGISVRCVKD